MFSEKYINFSGTYLQKNINTITNFSGKIYKPSGKYKIVI